jgi:hypothetical protein
MSRADRVTEQSGTWKQTNCFAAIDAKHFNGGNTVFSVNGDETLTWQMNV